MIALDSNLLVYAHRAAAPEHLAARAAIEFAAADPRGWGIALPSVSEFWMVATHPSSAGGPSTGTQAQAFLDALRRDGGMRTFLPRSGFDTRLAATAATMAVNGARVFDLQIGLIALEAGATEIWSHDRRFAAPRGLAVHDPLAAAG